MNNFLVACHPDRLENCTFAENAHKVSTTKEDSLKANSDLPSVLNTGELITTSGGCVKENTQSKEERTCVESNSKTKSSISQPLPITTTSSVPGTGRWTNDEHLLFLKGLEQYGKGWKKIAKLVKTRTVVQIRTHAQKYFQKLPKARRSGNTDLYLDGKTSFTRKGRFLRDRKFLYGSFANISKRDEEEMSSESKTLDGKSSNNQGKYQRCQGEDEQDNDDINCKNINSYDKAALSSYLAPHVRKWNEEGIETALFTFLTPATTDLDDSNEANSNATDPLLELEREEYDHNTRQYSYKLRRPQIQQNENQNAYDEEKLMNEHEIRKHLKNMECMGLKNHPIYAIFTDYLRKYEMKKVNESLSKNANPNQNCTSMNLYDSEEAFGTTVHGYFPSKIPFEIYSSCKIPSWYDTASDINSLLSCAQDMDWAAETDASNLKLN